MASGGKKNYAAIAAEKMYRPAEGRRKKPKILVYARNKKGKTRLSTTVGVDNIVLVDPEYGADTMKTINPHVWPVEKWEDMDDFYKWIRSDPVCPHCTTKHKFDWVGIDGLTRIANMALKYVMRIAEERDLDRQPGMVAQRDYGKSGELMKQMFTNFHTLDKGVIYTAHERQDAPFLAEEDEEVEEVTSTLVPDLPKGVRGAINGLVDVIGRLYVVQIEDEDGNRKPERRLWIGPSDSYDTGYRSDYELPPMIRKPTIPKLVRLMADGELKRKKEK
jgi:hypothetical protein